MIDKKQLKTILMDKTDWLFSLGLFFFTTQFINIFPLSLKWEGRVQAILLESGFVREGEDA